MKYDKPQIVCLNKAVFAIQGMPKQTSTSPDSFNQPNLVTVSAYEADDSTPGSTRDGPNSRCYRPWPTRRADGRDGSRAARKCFFFAPIVS